MSDNAKVLVAPALTDKIPFVAVEPIPTLPVAISVDVVMVEVVFKELTPNVENIVVPPLPPLPVPGGKPLILETVNVDKARLFNVMVDPVMVDAVMINPVSIDMVNVDPVRVDTDIVDPVIDDTVNDDPVMVDTDRVDPLSVDAVSVEFTLMELALKVEYAPTPGAPLLILETVSVDKTRSFDMIDDPDSVE